MTEKTTPKRMGLQAAKDYTGASVSVIRNAAKAGVIPAKRNGTGNNAPYIFLAADLDRWVESFPDA